MPLRLYWTPRSEPTRRHCCSAAARTHYHPQTTEDIMSAGSKIPDQEALRALTLKLREAILAAQDKIDEADQLLGELEEASGLVDSEGRRFDE